MIVNSLSVKYKDNLLSSQYTYNYNHINSQHYPIIITPKKTTFNFKTNLIVPKVGLMLVGFGGNNGSTLLGGIIANKEKLSWKSDIF